MEKQPKPANRREIILCLQQPKGQIIVSETRFFADFALPSDIESDSSFIVLLDAQKSCRVRWPRGKLCRSMPLLQRHGSATAEPQNGGTVVFLVCHLASANLPLFGAQIANGKLQEIDRQDSVCPGICHNDPMPLVHALCPSAASHYRSREAKNRWLCLLYDSGAEDRFHCGTGFGLRPVPSAKNPRAANVRWPLWRALAIPEAGKALKSRNCM